MLFCRTRITFDIDKIYRINKIQDIINTFLDLKEHLQEYIDFGREKFWFDDYPKRRCYPCVPSFINSSFYDVIYSDP